MEYSKVIKIRTLVKRFNLKRNQSGFPAIKYNSHQFAAGRWALQLTITEMGVFYSQEIAEICNLISVDDIIFFVGSRDGLPVLYFK